LKGLISLIRRESQQIRDQGRIMALDELLQPMSGFAAAARQIGKVSVDRGRREDPACAVFNEAVDGNIAALFGFDASRRHGLLVFGH